MYAIRRLEEKPGIRCWAVAFRRRGKPYYKRFYDSKCGGAKKAHRTAVAWRDRKLAKCRALTKREFRQILRSDNQSGAPGVMFLRSKRMPKGYWQAKMKLPITLKEITRSFSVRKYGSKVAYDRAVAARAEMLLMIEDQPFIKHPTAKRFTAKQAAD